MHAIVRCYAQIAMTPEELLFTDKSGLRTQLQDVIYDGLDVDYSDRYPALADLVRGGSPEHQLYAGVMLASWGIPEGLRAITSWARDPEHAPWATAPATFDRMSGVDAAFELCGDAIRISGELEARSAEADALRDEAVRALLGIYHRVFFGRSLMVAFDLDHALARRLAPELGEAVDRAIAAAGQGRVGFDLAVQAASLIAALATFDDARAARAAEALLALPASRGRALRELAYALGFGRDAATRALLVRLAAWPDDSVQNEAREALARRGGAG